MLVSHLLGIHLCSLRLLPKLLNKFIALLCWVRALGLALVRTRRRFTNTASSTLTYRDFKVRMSLVRWSSINSGSQDHRILSSRTRPNIRRRPRIRLPSRIISLLHLHLSPSNLIFRRHWRFPHLLITHLLRLLPNRPPHLPPSPPPLIIIRKFSLPRSLSSSPALTHVSEENEEEEGDYPGEG